MIIVPEFIELTFHLFLEESIVCPDVSDLHKHLHFVAGYMSGKHSQRKDTAYVIHISNIIDIEWRVQEFNLFQVLARYFLEICGHAYFCAKSVEFQNDERNSYEKYKYTSKHINL